MIRIAAVVLAAITLHTATTAERPEWALRGVWEDEGVVFSAGIGSDADQTRAMSQARAAALRGLAEFVGVRVRAETEIREVSTETSFSSRMQERIRLEAEARLEREAAIDRQLVEPQAGGGFMVFALARMPADELLPHRRLQAALAAAAEGRVARLLALADAYQAEGRLTLAELALLHATGQVGAGPEAGLAAAWFYQRQGDDLSARRLLLGALSDATRAGGEIAASAERLRQVLEAGLPEIRALVADLERACSEAQDARVLSAVVTQRGRGRFLVRWQVAEGPRRLLSIWSDDEDVAVFPLGDGPALIDGAGESAIDLDPSSRGGRVLVWALDPADPCWAIIDRFDRSLAITGAGSTDDRLLLRGLITALRRSARPGATRAAASLPLTLRP